MALARDRLSVIPVTAIPAIQPGDDLPRILVDAVSGTEFGITETDVLVVAQKVVSKAESAVVRLSDVTPDADAIRLAAEVQKDPRLVHIILSCSKRVVRKVPGVLITETHHGLICANAGVDASNSFDDETVILLPENPDGSARRCSTSGCDL